MKRTLCAAMVAACIILLGCSDTPSTQSAKDINTVDTGANDSDVPTADVPSDVPGDVSDDLPDTAPPAEDVSVEDSGADDTGTPNDVQVADVKPAPDVNKLPPDDPYDVNKLLETWYDDFNEGTDQSYLSADYELLPGGSTLHPDAVAHEAHLEVHYGPHKRNRLDFYRVKGATGPTPVAVFIHGGGYINGDKDQVHKPVTDIDRFLADGISVASIIYRWSYKDVDKALTASKPNDIGEQHDVNGTRLDYIHRDCARAIQFLRYKADEWGIDKTRLGAFGGSAGAACALWVATIPDLADATAADPVLKESTDLIVVGHSNSQPTMNFTRWPELLDLPAPFVFDLVGPKAQALGQMSVDDQIDTELGKQLSSVLDYYENLGPGGPAIYSVNGSKDSDETTITTAGEVIHHPRGHVAIYERCVEMGLECAIKTKLLDSGYSGDLVKFMIEQLNKP